MDSRRVTRRRRAAEKEIRVSPKVEKSPVKAKKSPVRRRSSSRPAARTATAASTKVEPPSPIKEVVEEKSNISPKTTSSNLPSTMTTNTSSRAPAKLTSTASVHSSYSSMTQKTIEIRSSASENEKVISKISEFIRRSVSKTLGDTETDSRYSRSVSRSIYDDEKSSKAEFSDPENKSAIEADEEEEVEEEEHYKSFSTTRQTGIVVNSSPPHRKIEKPQEFGGAMGVSLLLLIIPILVFYLQWTCGKNSCGFKSPNLKVILDTKYLLEKIFLIEAVNAYVAFNLVLFLLSGLVYGRHVRLAAESSKYVYNFNALPIAVLVTITAGVAEYLKYPVADFVTRHYIRFCIYGLLSAFIVSQWCYMRTRWQPKDTIPPINTYGNTGNFLIDFGLGRQLNPKWFGFVDYKQAFYRISLITTLIFAECFLYKRIQIPVLPADFPESANALEMVIHYAKNVHYDAGAVLSASLLLVYILDAIIFEHHLASSFELQGEGFGCLLLLRYAASPYLLSAVAKYFFDRRMPHISNCYILSACWLLLISGMVLKRLSSAIKYKYRTDPSNAHFHGIESIHTFQGRRLLLDTIWGRLRQPNYTGDIIALAALTSPLYIRFSWPPFISIVLLIVLLIHRTVRVNERNISKYHSSWVRYCAKVPYYILPKIY